MTRMEEALAIEGWMNPAELIWLEVQAHTRRIVVEFGAYKGRSTKVLAACAVRLHTVDWWNGDMEKNVLPEFMANLRAEIDSEKLSVHRMTTQDFGDLAQMEEPADMVFIDASHDYESVKRDIQTARELLGNGGLLCGHDFSNEWPGVQRAVRELCPNFQRVPGGDIWYEVQQ